MLSACANFAASREPGPPAAAAFLYTDFGPRRSLHYQYNDHAAFPRNSSTFRELSVPKPSRAVHSTHPTPCLNLYTVEHNFYMTRRYSLRHTESLENFHGPSHVQQAGQDFGASMGVRAQHRNSDSTCQSAAYNGSLTSVELASKLYRHYSRPFWKNGMHAPTYPPHPCAYALTAFLQVQTQFLQLLWSVTKPCAKFGADRGRQSLVVGIARFCGADGLPSQHHECNSPRDCGASTASRRDY